VAGQHIQEEGLSLQPAAAQTNLHQVRAELRLAIDRARLHLEWAEIALALTQWRFEEYTRQNAAVPAIPVDLPARQVVSVLLVQPRSVSLPAAQAAPDGGIDAATDAR
jgi:hypothetical protein